MTGFLWSDDADAFFGDDSRADSTPKSGARKKKIGSDQDAPLTVSQLSQQIKQALDQSIASFWLSGEIGTITQSAAGHVYLTLKDASSQIAAVIWRSSMERIDLELEEGMAVLVYGKLDVYPPRGSYQLIISKVEQQGIGELQAQFRKLFKRLDEEGLFAAERKKELPRFPIRIGMVTSPVGAAVHDFTQVLQRRWPLATVLIIPSKVQGDGAADEIARGIRVAAKIRPKLDVLVVGRGGGSLEDLWSFNEEVVVRALASCPIPTVSAVGHEIDVTLSDLVADVRALTPTEAGEIVGPSVLELADWLDGTRARLSSSVELSLARSRARLDSLLSRSAIQSPERYIEIATQRVDEAHRDLDLAIGKRVDHATQMLAKFGEVLDALSPLKTLVRGYSVTTLEHSNEILTDLEKLSVGDRIVTTLESGRVTSRIEVIEADSSK